MILEGVLSGEGLLYCHLCHDVVKDESMEVIRTKGGRYINGWFLRLYVAVMVVWFG